MTAAVPLHQLLAEPLAAELDRIFLDKHERALAEVLLALTLEMLRAHSSVERTFIAGMNGNADALGAERLDLSNAWADATAHLMSRLIGPLNIAPERATQILDSFDRAIGRVTLAHGADPQHFPLPH